MYFPLSAFLSSAIVLNDFVSIVCTIMQNFEEVDFVSLKIKRLIICMFLSESDKQR